MPDLSLRFKRNENVEHQVDFPEAVADIGLGLFRIGLGKTLKVQYLENSNQYSFEEENYLTYMRIIATIAAVVTFPLAIIGAAALQFSTSHSQMVESYNRFNQNPIQPQIEVQESISSAESELDVQNSTQSEEEDQESTSSTESELDIQNSIQSEEEIQDSTSSTESALDVMMAQSAVKMRLPRHLGLKYPSWYTRENQKSQKNHPVVKPEVALLNELPEIEVSPHVNRARSNENEFSSVTIPNQVKMNLPRHIGLKYPSWYIHENQKYQKILVFMPKVDLQNDQPTLEIVICSQANDWRSKLSSIAGSISNLGLTVYNGASSYFGQVGSASSQVGSSVYYGASTCVSCIGKIAYVTADIAIQILTVAAEVNKARLVFKKGIDLYPHMKDFYYQPRIGRYEKVVEVIDDGHVKDGVPPAMAIIMQGFAGKFGKDLGMLLKNMNILVGAKVAGELTKKLGLTQLLSEFGANQMLKLGNPLGWGSLLLSLVDIGSYAATLAQNNLLSKSKKRIEEYFAEKFDIESLRAQAASFEEEDNELAVRRGENLRAQLHNEEVKSTENKPKKERFRDRVKVAFLIEAHDTIVQGLQKTLEKTLTSMVTDLENTPKTMVTENINEGTAELAFHALRVFILGAEENSSSYSALSIMASPKPISETVLECNRIITKPVSYIKSLMPVCVKDAVNYIADPINKKVGEFVGEQAVRIVNDAYINEHVEKLRNIQLFKPEEMKLNLVDRALASPSLSRKAKKFIEAVDEYCSMAMEEEDLDFGKEGGLDELVSPLLENLGEFAASEILKIIADMLQPILEVNGLEKYNAADLMAKEIEQSMASMISTKFATMVGKGAYSAWKWLDSSDSNAEIVEEQFESICL